ncbi:hypothetical protein NHX12_011545 [Muraenolepis orangiensis]|uniref:Uncharacterized protein n=1 Tax=Muraenolepis orangiensis TaxID=630683 RepID=A0A9Q0I7A3_9TELE|nr:hypothetical protein NHX12_011545 [Muraenolepis orangiensis]
MLRSNESERGTNMFQDWNPDPFFQDWNPDPFYQDWNPDPFFQDWNPVSLFGGAADDQLTHLNALRDAG